MDPHCGLIYSASLLAGHLYQPKYYVASLRAAKVRHNDAGVDLYQFLGAI